jgi:hypothetical protein
VGVVRLVVITPITTAFLCWAKVDAKTCGFWVKALFCFLWLHPFKKVGGVLKAKGSWV